MANYEKLKQAVITGVYENGKQEITGMRLQEVLKAIISVMGRYSTFVGLARPSDVPVDSDGPVFYIATEQGTYGNFGNIELDGTEACVILFNGEWNVVPLGIPTNVALNALNTALQTLASEVQDIDGKVNENKGAIDAIRTADSSRDTLIASIQGELAEAVAGLATINANVSANAASIADAQAKIQQLTNALNALIGGEGDVTKAIDTFKEIENFLAGITDEKTLTGMLDTMKSALETKIQEVRDLYTSLYNKEVDDIASLDAKITKCKADLLEYVQNNVLPLISQQQVNYETLSSSLASVKRTADDALALARLLSSKIGTATEDAEKAQRSAVSAAESAASAASSVARLETAINNLPDGQAVSAQVAKNTADIEDLDDKTHDVMHTTYMDGGDEVVVQDDDGKDVVRINSDDVEVLGRSMTKLFDSINDEEGGVEDEIVVTDKFGVPVVVIDKDGIRAKAFSTLEGGDTNVVTIVVAQDGSGNFADIFAALNSITDASKKKPYRIFIKNGVYDITGHSYITPKNYVEFIGESKDRTIIRNSSASRDQSVACFDPVGANIKYAKISNMTLKMYGGKCCIHIDDPNAIQDGGVLEIDNVVICNEDDNLVYNGGINMGLHSGQTVKISNVDGNGIIFAHTSVNPTQVQNDNYLYVTNCNVLSIAGYDIAAKNTNHLIVKDCVCDFIGVGVSNMASQKTRNSWVYNIENCDFGHIWFIDDNTDWYSSYPFCTTIHRMTNNLSGQNISKGEIVSINNLSISDIDSSALLKHKLGICRYNDALGFYGVAMEDINNGGVGVIQIKGQIRLAASGYAFGDYVGLNSNGQLVKSTRNNSIGQVIVVDTGYIWILLNNK